MKIKYRRWAVLAVSMGLCAVKAGAQDDSSWSAPVSQLSKSGAFLYVQNTKPSKETIKPVSVDQFTKDAQKVADAKASMTAFLNQNEGSLIELTSKVTAHSDGLEQAANDLASILPLTPAEQAKYTDAGRKLIRNSHLMEDVLSVSGPRAYKDKYEAEILGNFNKRVKIGNILATTELANLSFAAVVGELEGDVKKAKDTRNALDAKNRDGLTARIKSCADALTTLDDDAVELLSDLYGHNPQSTAAQKASVSRNGAEALKNIQPFSAPAGATPEQIQSATNLNELIRKIRIHIQLIEDAKDADGKPHFQRPNQSRPGDTVI